MFPTHRLGAAWLRRLWRRLLGTDEGPQRIATTGRITVRIYQMDAVRERIPEWDELEKPEQLEALEAYGPAPVEEHVTTNTTVDGLNQYLVDHLDPNQSPTALDASHLALGTDNTEPSTSDSSLGAEQYREGVDSTTDAGKDLETSTLLDENEGNGYTYKELGLFTASSGGTMLNRSLIEATEKTDDVTATFEVVLQFRAGTS